MKILASLKFHIGVVFKPLKINNWIMMQQQHIWQCFHPQTIHTLEQGGIKKKVMYATCLTMSCSCWMHTAPQQKGALTFPVYSLVWMS